MSEKLAPETLCNHLDHDWLRADNYPLSTPIFQSVKFCIESFDELKRVFRGEREGYFYSRHGNPTVHQLEKLLAELQGTEAGWATSTGIAAITGTLLGLLQAGDRLVYFIESYRPSRVFAEQTLRRYGVKLSRLSMRDHEGIKAALALPDTKVVLFESMSNPQLQAPPIELIVEEAQKRGICTVLDNTFAGFQQFKDLPIDLYVHSLTKFASGHGDVMGGIVLGSRQRIAHLNESMTQLGATLDPHAAYLILRGMKTYHLRRRQQVANAEALALWLERHPAVESVQYPGLASHPQQAFFKERYDDCGSMLLVSLKNKKVDLERVVTEGRLFKLAASLGSTESLITPALFFFGGDLSPSERVQAGLDQSSIRLSIGIEALEDLKADLEQLLARV